MKKRTQQTPQEVELSNLFKTKGRIKAFFQFKKIKTWYDFADYVGLDSTESDKERPFTQDDFDTYFNTEEALIRNKYAPKIETYLPANTDLSISNRFNVLCQTNSIERESELVEDNRREINEEQNRIFGGKESTTSILLPTKTTREEEDKEYQEPHWTPKSNHPKQVAGLYASQERAAASIYKKIVLEDKAGILLQAGTGMGKTFVVGALLRRIVDNNWLPLKMALCPWPIMYVTKSPIIEQTKRVLKNMFGLNIVNQVLVTSFDQLRATYGDTFIEWVTKVKDGETYVEPQWKLGLTPMFVIWDECQSLKNTGSLQSKIGQALNEVKPIPNLTPSHAVYQLFMSATPFTRVCEAKCFAVAAKLPHPYNENAHVTNKNWNEVASYIAAPADPNEHSPSAIERLVTRMLDYIVDIKGIRPQFKARNGIKIIQFRSKEEEAFYNKAWERYLAEKAKIEGRIDAEGGGGRMQILAQFTKFRQAAELIRAEYIADVMYSNEQAGYAAVAACCFKSTISKVVQILIEKYKVNRNDISIVWGGLSSKIKVKKKKSETLSQQDLDNIRKTAETVGLSEELLEKMLDITEEVEEECNSALPKEYRLGIQNAKERQADIDKFNAGKSKYCLFTFKSGGVGLSLHHTDDLTEFKCRRKPSGYAVEEDIPKVPVRPRQVILTPTYSAIELVQGLGRCPRLTSLSDTYQQIVFYGGTIEERVALTVSMKLRCLKKVVRAKESWESVIIGAKETDIQVDAPNKKLMDSQEDYIDVPSSEDADEGETELLDSALPTEDEDETIEV